MSAAPADRAILEPIDLAGHFDDCVRFRRDSFFCSFGTEQGFDATMGEANAEYLARMKEKCLALPAGNQHMHLNGEIVGQLEMRWLADEQVAYVNLFYVVPQWRGSGLGRRLDRRANEVALELGATRLRLSASHANERALGVYRRLGWTLIGPRDDDPRMVRMERPVRL
ncbi:GNAT family N-acetyltransferase [soil metagenome]